MAAPIFVRACAGSSPLARGTLHPRLRGELRRSVNPSWLGDGSSPLTRGTHAQDLTACFNQRFIPAYAGNSPMSFTRQCAVPVHPRLRGELATDTVSVTGGSSPLTRGTQQETFGARQRPRFIPAYAGNSLKQGIEHLTNSSKDFLSGKYAKNPETVLNHFKNSSLD